MWDRRELRAPKRRRMQKKTYRASFVRGQRPTLCRGGPAFGVSAISDHLHHKKGKSRKRDFLFLWDRRELRAPKRRRMQKKKHIARRSCEGNARRFAEGAPPSGFRQFMIISTIKKGSPENGTSLFYVRQTRTTCAEKKENAEKNISRVVRARATPDALPRGPRLRGFGNF